MVCHGTGIVVPSEAECFWRLMAVAETMCEHISFMPRKAGVYDVTMAPLQRHMEFARGTERFDSLLRAVAASLSLEVAP
jgi:hypothetical protein